MINHVSLEVCNTPRCSFWCTTILGAIFWIQRIPHECPTAGFSNEHSAKSPNFDEENELENKQISQNQSIWLVFLLTSCLSKWFHRDKVHEIEAFLWLTSILDCKKELISQGHLFLHLFLHGRRIHAATKHDTSPTPRVWPLGTLPHHGNPWDHYGLLIAPRPPKSKIFRPAIVWLKQCHFYPPWLGMVTVPPIKMVMTGGWFIIVLTSFWPYTHLDFGELHFSSSKPRSNGSHLGSRHCSHHWPTWDKSRVHLLPLSCFFRWK